ncbi:MAG: hypothetical protein A3B89_04770 [Candidatus Buchananbacteria bacterium RIFCSPHIGHO2_02_FULL_40_13]|uniref:O-antigen ligase-related domain-containing protein n=1 Tax=Candidatus Buchananbacteria bacterium RIFCSPLOWO2_01_FULL_39_33 TaxID=1797543 RepID=A0A1G1YLM9_9BACT|nr:MAG: hypothetical protein A3B89_04770 [Candidatus Buchananbacteria bacterium RIFCSPHIGHO2_02_FULL_40_13]OGY53258.1 MAG: hypothetical protein A3A02_01050 [Candidatus Buchananbacteria bacterium RIFCSPLOWO2_01_FULL_39_33]
MALLIFGFLFAWLSYKDIKLAIYVVVAFLPSYLIRSSIFNLPFTLLEMMIILVFLSFLIKNKLSWLGEFKNNVFFWPMVAILAIATISLLISPNWLKAAGSWKAYFIEPILFYIVLTATIKSKKQLENVFWALGISATYLSLIAFGQYFSGWNMPESFLKQDGSVDRVVSIFGYPNALGLYLGPIIILFTGFNWWSKSKTIIQALKIAIILVSFITIILAKSEAAIFSVLLVWLLGGIIYKKTRSYFIILAILAVLTLTLIPSVNSYVSEKIWLRDWSGIVRRHIWQETWAMLKDNPVLGAGLAGYQTKIVPYHIGKFEIFLYPHNIILNFWSELGLLGLASFIWLWIKFGLVNLKAYWQNKNNLLNLTLLMVISQMLIQGLADVPYFKNDLSVLFWLIIGIYTINLKITKNVKS